MCIILHVLKSKPEYSWIHYIDCNFSLIDPPGVWRILIWATWSMHALWLIQFTAIPLRVPLQPKRLGWCANNEHCTYKSPLFRFSTLAFYRLSAQAYSIQLRPKNEAVWNVIDLRWKGTHWLSFVLAAPHIWNSFPTLDSFWVVSHGCQCTVIRIASP